MSAPAAAPACTDLRIADGFALPLDAVTETIAILGKRGSGKTSTAVVLTEEFIAAGQQTIVIDPLGVWWGLRSSADGEGDGLPVVILGGAHADLPLVETAGARIADILVAHRASAVLDVSDLPSKAAQRRFVADFLERLYHANRDPLHVVLDEADLWAPQRTDAGGARVMGVVQDVQRRGRARGIGTTMITQRPQVLSKDILSQAEVLVAMRMAGVRDVAAIDEWVRLHADDDQATAVKSSLPSLPVGTAWVWSAGWLHVLEQVRIRRRITFDSSATPRPGQHRVEAKRMAAVDLAALAELIADNDTGGDDPAALRRRIDDLERRLAARPATTEVVREVPVLTDDDRHALKALLASMDETSTRARTLVDAILSRVNPAIPAPAAPDRRAATDDQVAEAARGRYTALAPVVDMPAPDGATTLRAGARRMLDVCARHHPLWLTRAQLATLSGIAVRGGTFSTYYSGLRRAGLITEHDDLTGITPAGMTAAGATTNRPMTADEVREQWRGVLRAGARTMLDVLIAAHPGGMTRADLAEAAGVAVTGGTFGTYLSTLRRNGLVTEGGGQVRAADVLFLAPTG